MKKENTHPVSDDRTGEKREKGRNGTSISMRMRQKNKFISEPEVMIPECPVVGIGVSNDGMEALELFFRNIPGDSDMAFVIIQHSDNENSGIMAELLQGITELKVFPVDNGIKVAPNCIYLSSPDCRVSLINGMLHSYDSVATVESDSPVNYFFRSLAAERHEKSIGIILSGMTDDGSRGVKAIKEKRGIVLVQDPCTARFECMPASAVKNVTADIIAPVEDLSEKLMAFITAHSTGKIRDELDSHTRNAMDTIIMLLRERCGHDFSLYKKNTLLRRIERRKNVHHIDKTAKYVRLLQENPGEIDILFKEMLIGVTGFFRDNKVWEKLRTRILPVLFDELPDGYVLRSWVTACSTGEEAYSLAMVFKEALEKTKRVKNLSLQIFATDIDNDAITIARKGIYSSSIASSVSTERLNRFFTKDSDGFRVSTAIREMIVFAQQNLIKDPPFTKLDIITCRNMLIYTEPELQKKLLTLFNYSLNPGGIMLLGTAETCGSSSTGFEEFDTRLKVYKRGTRAPTSLLFDFPASFLHRQVVAIESKAGSPTVENIQTIVDQIILQRFAPASVLINNEGDILYITGRTGKYLEPSSGKANWNIHVMARDGLRHELPGAIRKALQNFDPVVIRNVKVGANDDALFVDVTVQRIENPVMVRGMIMIVFKDQPPASIDALIDLKARKKKVNTREKELEMELRRSHEELQSIREEMQSSQEELKSANEELQSTNEELQSTNEELTTSKEEMHSLNEELQTVNSELQRKITDYAKSIDDMKNLLNSTEIATLFLDKDLNIRRYTDPVANIFKVRPADIGRPFTDLANDLQYAEMCNDTRKVLDTTVSIEMVIAATNGRWFTVRIMPYRTTDDRIDGLVLTFIDISLSKKLEEDLIKANKMFVTTSNVLYRKRQ